MLDTIGAFGSGIGTNLLSDSLSKKLEAFKDKKAIASFTQSLRDWEIEFEKQNDGTIITNGAFYSHVKYHNVIENIVAYVLEPSMNAVTEDEFLNCLHEKMVNRIEETTEKKLSWNDSRLIRNFLTHLLTTTRAFLFQKISLEDRGLFYLVCQNNAKLEHLERIVKEKFQMQDQNVQQIVEQLSMAIQKSETEERIKAKMASWNSRQIKNLGNRYTPDLNIPVEIMDSLHGASVDQQFQNIFYDKVDKFLIAMRHTELSEINALCDAIEKYAIELNFFNITSSDIDVIISTVNAIKDFLTSKIEEYYENPEGKKNFDSKAYQLYEKLGIANEFNDYLTNTTVRVAVSPYIILAGDGGVGKSHLIADYIDNCDSLGQTSLLLLGQQFSAGMDVLAILPTLLGCDITYHELFDIFEAIACTQKSRVLICIDALNEGAGVTFWNSVLGGLVDFLKEFPHIGLLVSVRTQYEDSLFDGQDTLRAQMQRIEHFGFTTVEHDAMHQYFSFYGITIDPVVFPISEFRNPLFLRLFCTANRNTHISLGDISLPFVYSQYISVMEQKVAKRCNYNKSYKLISKIIDEMVSKRINEHSGTVSLSLDDTLALIVDICKKWNVNTDVYSALLAEGVLTQGITYNGDEYVYITFLLLLPVAGSHTAAAVAGIKVVDQPFEADDEIIVLIKSVDIFCCRQNPHIMFSEIVDKECGLRPVTAQAGQVFNDDRFDLARFDHLIDFVDALTVEVHTADIVIEGFAHHLVAVADGKVVYDFSLVIQRVEFFVLISGQPVIEPNFHNRSFPLWCADHARHTIAHKFLNS